MEEVRVPMPEIEQSNFIKENIWQLNSAFLEFIVHESGDRGLVAKPLIQRLPFVIRSLKVDFIESFEPMQVALGPLLHGNEKFKLAEQTKLKLATRFVFENKTNDIAYQFHMIKAEIEDLRKCYNKEDIEDYDDDQLAWMFFVDGCALLATLYSYMDALSEYGQDIRGIYLSDLLVLENQLPYRVLKILIGSSIFPDRWEKSIRYFIDENLSTHGQKSQQDQEEEEERHDYVNLLERMRTKLLSGKVKKKSSSVIGRMILHCGASRKDRRTFHGFKELHRLGIRVRRSTSNNITDISFYCNFLGCLKMPPLVVDDSTASKFMSLVALEHCPDFKNGLEVTSYLCFLGSLIQTAEDVKELRASGMLHNYFGNDEEVATLFRRMCKSLQPNQEMYKDVTEDVNMYCNSWVIRIYSHYFSSNWSFIAFLGAVAGLVLTLIQAYFAIKKNMSNTSSST